MENATKALLIAAAVLIVIVIIALGVRLLSPTADVSDSAEEVSQNLSDASNKAYASLYNSTFEAYFGKKVSKKRALELVDKIIENNKNEKNKIDFNYAQNLKVKSDGKPQDKFWCTHGNGNGNVFEALRNMIENCAKTDTFKIEATTTCGISKNGYDGESGYLKCVIIWNNKE